MIASASTTKTLLAGADIAVGPHRGLADVLIGADGRIEQIHSPSEPPSQSDVVVIDAKGHTLLPGLVDLFAGLMVPGDPGAETVESLTNAALAGGYTAVVTVAAGDTRLDDPSRAELWPAVGPRVVYPAASLLRNGDDLVEIAALAQHGIHLFGDLTHGMSAAGLARRAFDYVRSVRELGWPVRIVQPALDHDLSDGGVMHEGAVSSHLGLPGICAEAEELAVTRNLLIARLTNAPLHMSGIATAAGAEQIRRAKADGVNVTADTCVANLVLSDDACAGFDSRFHVLPPLRRPEDCEALWEAVSDGTIDAVRSGHWPVPDTAKEQPFDQAPPGMIGLDSALGVMLSTGRMSWEHIAQTMSAGPARIAGVEAHGQTIARGATANLVLIDPQARWQIAGHRSASIASVTPFEGREAHGAIRLVICDGAVEWMRPADPSTESVPASDLRIPASPREVDQ